MVARLWDPELILGSVQFKISTDLCVKIFFKFGLFAQNYLGPRGPVPGAQDRVNLIFGEYLLGGKGNQTSLVGILQKAS